MSNTLQLPLNIGRIALCYVLEEKPARTVLRVRKTAIRQSECPACRRALSKTNRLRTTSVEVRRQNVEALAKGAFALEQITHEHVIAWPEQTPIITSPGAGQSEVIKQSGCFDFPEGMSVTRTGTKITEKGEILLLGWISPTHRLASEDFSILNAVLETLRKP